MATSGDFSMATDRWHKGRWVYPDTGCPVGSFTEQD